MPRLQRLDGVLGDHRPRPQQLDLAQLGAAPAERLQRDVDAGGDRAADVLPARADHVEGGGGAEVDDDRRTAEQLGGREGVDDPVGADLARVVHQHRYAGAHARLDDHLRARRRGSVRSMSRHSCSTAGTVAHTATPRSAPVDRASR